MTQTAVLVVWPQLVHSPFLLLCHLIYVPEHVHSEPGKAYQVLCVLVVEGTRYNNCPLL